MRALLLTALLALPSLALAQGSLTPPGAPAPTMKTLEQIEPRTPLQAGAPGVTVNANGGFSITAPGSYYLTKDLTVATGDGIVISSDNVSLDLGGFAVTSSSTDDSSATTGPTFGIMAESDWTGISITNGHIRSGSGYDGATFRRAGFAYGIAVGDTGTEATRISAITVTGTGAYGIYAFPGSVEDCSVSLVGNTGICATVVQNCVAGRCVTIGIYACSATNCYGGISSRDGIGINALTAVGCYGHATDAATNSTGLSAETATSCYGMVDGDGGIGLTAKSAVSCSGFARGHGGKGLTADTASGCTGWTSSGTCGLDASYSAENSVGQVDFGTASDTGLYARNAINCDGRCGAGTGLAAVSATNCHGISSASTGLKATSATNCYGTTQANGVGLDAVLASACYGTSVNNTGLRVEASAENCRGVATGTGYGLYSGGNATNCTGKTATGNYGLFVVGAASLCRGDNNAASATKFALHAGIAVACTAETGTIEAAQRFHGTP